MVRVAAGKRRLLVLGIVLLVAVGVFGPPASQVFPDLVPGQRDLAAAMALAPRQQWGDAEGQQHEEADTPPNQAEPVSLQGKYPPIVGSQSAQAAPNEVRVESAEPGVRGFDRASSQELPDQRGRQERTYRNSDGTLTSEFAREPVNYRSGDGTWQPVDPGIEAAGADGWRNRADSVGLTFAPSADAERIVRMKLDDQHEFAYGLRGAAASAGVVDGSTITYPDVLPGADLKLESRPGGVKEIVVLDGPDAPHSWTFPLRLKGLTAKVVDGRVVLTDERGAERAVVPAGFMTDSAVDPRTGDPALSDGVKYSIVDDALKVELDSAWLRDPARRYPVLVDPSVREEISNSSAYVLGGGRFDGAQDLRVGTNGSAKAASYLAFDGIENRLRDHKVFGAQLYLTEYWSWSCEPRPITVHAVTQPWGTSGGFPGPSVGPALADASFAHGYIAPGQAQSNCPTAAEVIDLGAPGRDLVQRWVNGTQANYGLSVRASETDPVAWKKFTGHGTANPPRLFVTHSEYDAEYRIDRGVPEPPVHALQGGKVKITVTNRGAQTWTPSTFALGYRSFTAQGSPQATVEAAQLPGDVPRGASVTLDAYIQAMPIGDYILDFSMLRKGGPWFTDEQIAPARLTFRVVNVKPIVKAQYPPNGFSAPTLTPQLWVDAVDVDSPPDRAPQYRFEVCENTGVGCVGSGYVNDRTWTVPVGALRWSKDYQWRAFAFDGQAESEALPPSHLLTAVPQPEITSHLANAPYGGSNKNFDPQTGNYYSSAIDATVAVTGPALDVVRTYNSLDPRRDLAFGAGWSTRYDMRVLPDDDGSGNVVVTYPDGQQVRFGRNADGSFSPPQGRYANFRTEAPENGGGWLLTDKAFTSYVFRPDGRLFRTLDESGHWTEIDYDGNARIKRAISRTSDRILYFTWSGGHVTSVATDRVGDKQLTWTYTYTGDKLTKVCDPRAGCTGYDYETGSHYRSAVIDSQPASYWRLGDPQGTKAESQVRTNLGKDDGVSTDVTPTPGAAAGTTDGAGNFNGTSSVITLPDGMVRKNRDLAVELWFKTTEGGPLFGYQKSPITGTPVGAVPVLYVGQDGKLRGQFWNGGAHPITSTGTVNDGQWHHVVLSGSLATQTLYLDGAAVGTQAGEIDHSDVLYSQIGAGYTVPPSAWDGWGTEPRRFFKGQIDEVAYYEHPVGPTAVRSHFLARTAADQLTKLTVPSGRTQARLAYDVVNDRVREFTDENGGLWRLGTPAVTGTADNLVRTTQVTDPGNRYHFYDFDPKRGRILRYVAPLGLGTRDEDSRDPSGAPSKPPTPTCPTTTTTPVDTPPVYCGGPGNPGGGWIGGPVNGQGVRAFDYDEQGFQSTITDENGNKVVLTSDQRGNQLSRKTCRVLPNDCQTSYSAYYLNPADLTDARNDKVTATRDARSSGAADDRFATRFEYSGTGQRGLLLKRTAPDGGETTFTYSDSATAAFDTGTAPAGLVASTKDSRQARTTYRYFRNGDLAEEKSETTGLTTRYTYDVLGRTLTRTQLSDIAPQTTTFAYDELSRRTTTTLPATTDAVTAVKHTARTTTGYDADGRPTRVDVADLTGGDATRTTVSAYDDRGRLSATTDAEGGQTFFGYDAFGNSTWLVDAGGTKYEYAYTARNKIAEVRVRSWHGDPVVPGGTGGDGDGPKQPGSTLVLQSFTYDLAGRTIRQTDAMGRTKRFEYYNDDLVRKVVARGVHDPLDPNAPVRDVLLEEDSYDAAGNPIKQVTPGNRVTTNEFDAAGRVKVTVLDPTGLNRKTELQYDTEGNRTQVKRTGASSNSVRIDTGRVEVVDFGYDPAGRPTTQTVTNGAQSLVTTRTYDQRGLLRSVTDPRGAGFTTDLGYDELGNAVSTTGPAVQVETGGAAAVSARPVNRVGLNTFGDTSETQDPNGRTATSVVDRLGRVVRTESPDYTKPGESTAGKSVVRTEYDALGNPVKETDPRGGITKYRYDQLGRLREMTRPDPGGTWYYTYTRVGERLSTTDPTGARVEATYDDLGRQVTSTALERRPTTAAYTTKLGYDDANNLTRVTAPSGEVTRHDYDVLGELITTTDPAGVVSRFGYDLSGGRVRESDGLGRTSFLRVDAAGRPTGSYQLDADERILRQTSRKYDDAGNLVEVRNPLNEATTFSYDAGNRLVGQVEPVAEGRGITTTFGYDAAGARTRFTDGRGNTSLYTNNSLGLPESVVEPATAAHPNAADRTWQVGYDLAGNPVSAQAPGGVTRTRTYDVLGRLTQETGSGAEAATATRTLGYDAAGRMTSFNAPGGTNTVAYNDRGALLDADGPSGSTEYTYDANGRVATQTDAGGTTTSSYTNGRLATVRDGVTGATRTLGYNGAGQVKSVDYGAGNLREYGYDDFGRLSSDTLRGGSATINSTAYGYDLADRLTRKTIAAGPDNTYGYDRSGRLTSWTVGGTTTGYEWDDAGNRTKIGAKSATYDQRNRLLSDGDNTYTWSARGTAATRTGAAGTETYGFDAFDRAVTRGTGTYAYDGLDRMITRNGAAFTYVGTSLDVSSDSTTRYSRGVGGDLLSLGRGDDKRALLTDQHGDVVGGFDPSTQLTALTDTTTFDPFGKVLASSGTRPSLGYQGDWTDPDSGQVDMGARWYDPSTGGFTARDSAGLPSSPSGRANRYAYGAGSPTNFVDPDGHDVCTLTRPETCAPNKSIEKFLDGVGDVLKKAKPLYKQGLKFTGPIGRIYGFLDGDFETAGGCRDQLEVDGQKCRGWYVVKQNGAYARALDELQARQDRARNVQWTSLLNSIVAGIAAAGRAIGDFIQQALAALQRVPTGSSQVAEEVIAKEVALPISPQATAPLYVGGQVSANPALPANQTGVAAENVQDEISVNDTIRDIVLGAGNTVIQNVVQTDPSELGQQTTTGFYTNDGVYRIVRDENGVLVRIEQAAWNLIGEAQGNGVNISADKVVQIGKDPNGKIVFLEVGGQNPRTRKWAGLAHVLEHKNEFIDKGIAEDMIGQLVHRAVTEGSFTGYCQGTRPIFSIECGDRTYYLSVQVSSNGFIVGANTRSGTDPFKSAKRDPRADEPNYRGW
jgi:RHS repeat-associated protein